jgi:hypothetical protein
LALVLPFYFFLVESAKAYGDALRALVDVTRFDLAETMHLVVPTRADDERSMWSALSNLAAWGMDWPATPQWERDLRRFRKETRMSSRDSDLIP